MPKRNRLAFRTGDLNAAGGKPLNPSIKTYRCVTANIFGVTATTAGAHGVFIVNSYNTPTALASTVNWAQQSGVSGLRHPSGHTEVLADGYDTFLVLKSNYHIWVRWAGVSRTLNLDEWVFAYKFDSNGQTAIPAFPVTLATTDTWLDIQQSPGWVWKRFTSDLTNNTTPLKSGGIFNINVPDVVRMGIKLNENTVAQFTMDDLQGAIADSAAVPAVVFALHFVVFLLDKDGDPEILVANDILMDVRCTQTIKMWKAQTSDEIVDMALDDV